MTLRELAESWSLRLNQGQSSDGQLLVDVGVSDYAETGVWTRGDPKPEGRRHFLLLSLLPQSPQFLSSGCLLSFFTNNLYW